MICFRCGLPDQYRGQGDGIGSCDCPRCECCEAAPDECDCAQDTDYLGEEELSWLGDDYLCNDVACPTGVVRRERRAVSDPGSGDT